MSAATGPNPFSRTSGFTQPLNQTKAVREYDGNVDFDKEKTKMGFMRTTGRDLNQGNPYVQRDVPYSNFQMIKERILEACYARNEDSFEGLKNVFNRFDKDGNGQIDPVEFRKGMYVYGVTLTEEEVT